MPRHRRHSVEFKRQVVAEYLAGESAHMLGRRHDLSRNLIRSNACVRRVEKAGAGQLDQDVVAADLLGAHEAKISRAGAAGRPASAGDRVSKKGAEDRPIGDKRALVRDCRPDGLSIERGCALMGLPRSTYCATGERPSDEALVGGIREITDEFECYGYRRVGAELRHRGQVVNGKKVRRLMRERPNRIGPRAPRPGRSPRRTTRHGEDAPLFLR